MPFISSNVSVTFSDTNKVDSNLVDSGEDFLSVFPGSLVLGQVDNVSSIGALTLESSGSGVLTLSAVTNSSSVGGLTLTDGSGVTFSVADYGGGADPTGVADSTAAIQATINAARAVASVSTPVTVLFPAGTYKIIPPGTARVTVYKKTVGVWGSALATDISTDQVVDTNFYYQSAAPESGDGIDGAVWFNKRTGLFYKKTSGTWGAAEKMMDGAGTGWICQYSATDLYPTYKVTPDNADGSDGDYAVMYRMQYDNQGLACFLIEPEDSYITFQGSGVGSTKLLLRCFSDEDPADYTVDEATETVLTSRIPGSMRTDFNKGSRNHARGSAFVMKAGSTETITNVKWDGIWFEGGTTANGRGSYYTEFDSAHEWDQAHKGIVFTWDIGTVVGAEVTNCKFTGWRGENLYKGGIANDAEITIQNCTFSDSNASVISVSGNVTVEDCTFARFLNAFENHAESGQGSIIRRCTMTGNAGDFQASNGIVLIGDTASSFEIDSCTITGMTSAAIYGAESLHNGTISNCTLSSSQAGIKFNLATTTNLSPGYSDINFTNIDFVDTYACFSIELVTAGTGSTGWVIDGCTCSGNVNRFLLCGIQDKDNFDPIIQNCTIASTANAFNLLKPYANVPPVVPKYSGNTYTPPGTEEIRNASPGVFIDTTPSGPIIDTPTIVNVTDYQLVPERFFIGESIRINNRSGTALPMAADASWNNWSSAVSVLSGGYAILTVNANGKFDFTSSGWL